MSEKHLARYGLWILFVWMVPSLSNAQQTDSLDLGYRKIGIKDFNGSAYTITTRELENLPVTNLSNLLTGLVPGLFSIQTSGGTVNESADYWIRGIRTSAEGILVLVDGQERDFGILSSREVESITVIKDASVSVLYGTRAANGIILVTTKKGVKGRPNIEVSTQFINQQPLGLLSPVDALTYARNYNEAMKYDGRDVSTLYSDTYLQQYRNRNGVNQEQYPDVDWLGTYLKKSSWVQRHNVNVSGGSDRTRYFINGGFISQNGMFNTDNETSYNTNNSTSRYNLRSNLEVDVTPTTVLNVDLYGWYDRQNRPGGDVFAVYNALVNTPANAFPAYYLNTRKYTDQDGSLVDTLSNKIVTGNGLHSNPWAMLNRNGYSLLNRIYGSFRAKLTQDFAAITPGLSASILLSMDGSSVSTTSRQRGYAYYQRNDFSSQVLQRTGNDGRMANGITDINSQTRNSFDAQVSYDRAFGKHRVLATTFYNQYEFDDQTSIPSRFQTIGYWLGYNFDQKYYLDFTGSYHGVYKFAPDDRFGFFPAVSAGWAVSNEKFFQPLQKVVSYFKIRGSYASVGNHRGVDEFRYKSRLNSVNAIYNFGNAMGNVGGYIEDIIANPGLTWEKSKQLSVGADLTLFDSRLSYTIDYFRDNRTEMYMANNNITSLFGTTITINENIGEMFSKGVEMGLSWNSRVGNLGYRLGATYSLTDNEIVKTGEISEPYPWLMSAGYARGIRYGYDALGLFQSYDEIASSPRQTFSEVQPGDIKYRDVNGDGMIDRNDQIPLGYGNVPREFYGIHGGLSFKNIGLNFLVQGAGRVTQMLSGKVAFPFVANGNMYEHQLDYWTPENPNASMPNISAVNSGVNNTQSSSFWMKNTSYVRLKTLELYYELSEKTLKKAFLNNLRIFANGYNLWVWSPGDSPLDPEDNGSANTMPLTRNVSVGLSARF